MKTQKILLSTLAIAAFTALSAMAVTPATAPGQGQQGSGWCAQHQQECQAKKAKRQQWCQKNPQKCEAIKAKRKARLEARCKQDPSNPKCQKLQSRGQS
jgi:hypothetical protein